MINFEHDKLLLPIKFCESDRVIDLFILPKHRLFMKNSGIIHVFFRVYMKNFLRFFSHLIDILSYDAVKIIMFHYCCF